MTDSNGLKISQESGDESRIFNHYSGPLTFGTANAEKLRIESGGNALFTTNQVKLYNATDTSNTYFYAQNTGAGNAGIKMQNNQGEWTIIANDSLRFRDEDASADRLRIESDGNLVLQPTNMGTGSLYPYMNVLNGQIKKYMQLKVLNSGQGTKFTFTGTDRTSALITIKVSHSWTASNTGNRHGSAIFAAKFFTTSSGSAGWGGITLIQTDGYSTGNFILANESGFGYSIKVNNPLGDSGVTFCYDIEVMSASNTSKHSLTSVTVV